ALDVVLGQVPVDLRVARIAVVLPAGAEQEVHDVQAEAGVARPGLAVEQAALGDAADVAFLVDARLEDVGVDLHVGVGLPHADVGGAAGATAGGGEEGGEQQRGENGARHGRSPLLL